MNLLSKPIILLCSVAGAASRAVSYGVPSSELVPSNHNELVNVVFSSPNYPTEQLSSRRKRSTLRESGSGSNDSAETESRSFDESLQKSESSSYSNEKKPPKTVESIETFREKMTSEIRKMSIEHREYAGHLNTYWYGWAKGALTKLNMKLDQEKALTNHLGIVFYFRVRYDQSEVILSEDENVKKELERLKRFVVEVPEEVKPDGTNSFIGRFRTWYAIGLVLADETKKKGYIAHARKIFKEVGLNTQDPALFATSCAMLFNKLSREVKTCLRPSSIWTSKAP